MLNTFAFDPRRYFDFFDTVFDPLPTRAQMRRAMGNMSDGYYELWKVKPNFDIPAFFAYFNAFNFSGLEIHVCAIRGDEHELLRAVY